MIQRVLGGDIMKKIIALFLSACMLIMATGVFAQDVTVKLNGTALSFDVNPFIENDRTLVPVRGIFEAIGAVVNWDEESRTVIVSYDVSGEPVFVVLQIDNKDAFVNGEKKALDVPAKIVEGRTFVPVRFIMEALDSGVEWDQTSYTVSITK